MEKKGDKYVLLGGKIEKGETVLTSAKREIKEELGILLSKLKYISSRRISGREIHFVKGRLSEGLFGKIRLEKKLKMAWVQKRVFFENALFPCPKIIRS
ncbi:MAG: NUDIX domain-containing protein [Ignavibacteriaceae bacterium]|nr:NUDIX domain-containing protein [Ignavibacteriaceae bacterium]